MVALKNAVSSGRDASPSLVATSRPRTSRSCSGTLTQCGLGDGPFRAVWISAAFSPKRIQAMMGHASIDLTFGTYGYLFEARMDVEKATQRTESIVSAG